MVFTPVKKDGPIPSSNVEISGAHASYEPFLDTQTPVQLHVQVQKALQMVADLILHSDTGTVGNPLYPSKNTRKLATRRTGSVKRIPALIQIGILKTIFVSGLGRPTLMPSCDFVIMFG
jgi:hypothetical protein